MLDRFRLDRICRTVKAAWKRLPLPSFRLGSLLRCRVALLLGLAVLLGGPAAATVVAQEIKVELVNFGVANCARPGEWVGIRLAASSSAQDVKKIELVLESINADGDVVENSRVVNIANGQRVEKWLYVRLPPNSSAQSVVSAAYTVRVFEVDEAGRRVNEITSSRFNGSSATTTSVPVDQLFDLFLVMGDARLGLEGFSRRNVDGSGMLPSLNALATTIQGATPRDLPDRWEGLSQFQAILWCDPQRDPALLDKAQAEALREWLRRGGTLVIGVAGPGSVDGWYRKGGHELSDLVPTIPPQRTEGVPLRTLLPILSKSSTIRNENAATDLATFDRAMFDPKSPGYQRGWRPLVALPSPKVAQTGYAVPREKTLDGAILGVQRNVGFGQVIVLGVDVDFIHRYVQQADGLPQADVFWNRILGRRGDTPTSEEMLAIDKASRLYRGTMSTSSLGSGETVASYIGMAGSAAIGILSAAVLFGSYWLLSGPLGFAGLKHFQRQRHAWMLFVVFAFLFTAVAWVGGALLGQTTPSLRHLTVIDQLAFDPMQADPTVGIPDQRATTWFSAFLPGYSPTEVSVGGAVADGNLLASWAKPPSGTGDTFPNKDRYRVPFDQQFGYRVPSRATSVYFIARWRGVIAPSWGGGLRMDSKSPVRLSIDRNGGSPVALLSGAIINDLPGELEQVTFILVTPFRTELPRLSRNSNVPAPVLRGQLPLEGRLFRRAANLAWKPGQAIELSEIFDAASSRSVTADLESNIRDLYQKPILNQTMLAVTGENMSVDSRRRYLEALSLFSMLQPPEWLAQQGQTVDAARSEREHARELDLGPWFTRPCLIVMGFLEDKPTPVPVTINGATVGSTGTTLFRWICPLDSVDLVDFAIPTLRMEDPPVAPTPPPAVAAEPVSPAAAASEDPAADAPPPSRPKLTPSAAGPTATPARRPGKSP